MRRGVTLIELLFAMAIIVILAGVGMGAYSASVAQARVYRTRSIITRLDTLITAKWESYRTRAVPIKIPAVTNPAVASRTRLYALRELMRCELPDRQSDVTTPPAMFAMPSLQKNYWRRATATWTTQHEGAECLYLIVAAMRDGDDNALDAFADSEIGDVDGDGMKEILDGAGQPIEFLRWAPGYVQEAGSVTHQTRDFSKAPDIFDPLKSDPRWSDADQTFNPFALSPLIFSPGPDREYDITTGPATGLNYSTTTPPNDPYLAAIPEVGTSIGTGSVDNITNHDAGAK